MLTKKMIRFLFVLLLIILSSSQAFAQKINLEGTMWRMQNQPANLILVGTKFIDDKNFRTVLVDTAGKQAVIDGNYFLMGDSLTMTFQGKPVNICKLIILGKNEIEMNGSKDVFFGRWLPENKYATSQNKNFNLVGRSWRLQNPAVPSFVITIKFIDGKSSRTVYTNTKTREQKTADGEYSIVGDSLKIINDGKEVTSELIILGNNEIEIKNKCEDNFLGRWLMPENRYATEDDNINQN